MSLKKTISSNRKRGLTVRKTLFVIFAALLTASCTNIKAIVIDTSNLQTNVHKMRLKNGNLGIRLLEGEGERVIPLKMISWIKISPREVENRDGRTYFLTELELKDGTKVMTYRLKDGRKSSAYVCVDDVIEAETNSGPMKVDLSKISKINFE
jgi:hypothetical protein